MGRKYCSLALNLNLDSSSILGEENERENRFKTGVWMVNDLAIRHGKSLLQGLREWERRTWGMKETDL